MIYACRKENEDKNLVTALKFPFMIIIKSEVFIRLLLFLTERIEVLVS